MPIQTAPTLDGLCRRIHEVSTLPHIAIRVMEVANDENATARDMKEVMEADAALSMRVLRCVNSSAYALRSKVTNLQQAIAYLGMKQIRNVAMTASVSRFFESDASVGSYSRKALWRHFVAVGVCARLVAMRLRLQHFEDVFLAGLLHDVGIVLEDQHAHNAFISVVESLHEKSRLCDEERQQLGFDHTMLGAHVAKAWHLPGGAVDAIRYHHDSNACKGDSLSTVQCVELANFLCALRGYSSMGMQLVEFPRSTILAMNLGKDDLVVLANDLDREFASNQTLFHT